MADENHIGLHQSIQNFSNSKSNKKDQEIPNGIFVFVSFDLVNSTKFKYRNPHWINMIKELIKSANNYWFGLDFWKFNGDELLYYAEITSISQLVWILHRLNQCANELEQEIIQKMHDDKMGMGFEVDLIGIKTAIWLAVTSDDDSSLNSRLFDFESVDFAGINMDEGFRMSKCAIQNKIIVDPKIALLICSMADEVMNKRVQSLTDNEVARIKELKQPVLFEDVFSKFWINQDKRFEFDFEDMLKIVANNFRIISYENCKGVWDDRPYPIIWYSDNWQKLLTNVKYDEKYKNDVVDNSFINHFYSGEKEACEITFDILKKIYEAVSAYSLAIRKILLNSNLDLWSSLQLDKHIVSKTYLYYSVICINKKTKGVLVFLRSQFRGHLPCVWDFDHQKNAQDTYGQSAAIQIEDRFKENFDLRVKIVLDKKRKSPLPMAIHPIYRKGKMHHGIICIATIEEDLSEEDILDKIRKKLPNLISGYGYEFYSDVMFIHNRELFFDQTSGESYFIINDDRIKELTEAETSSDSNSWRNHNKHESTINRCTTNLVLSALEAIEFITNNEE